MIQEKKVKFLINSGYYALLIALGYISIRYVLPIILPFVIGLIVASIVRPLADFIAKKIKINKKITRLIFVALFYCIIGVIVLFGSVKLLTTIRDFVFQLPSMYKSDIMPFLNKSFEGLSVSISEVEPTILPILEDNFKKITDSLGQTLSSVSMSIVKSISNFASTLPAALIKLIITVIASFFFIIDYEKATGLILRFIPKNARGLAIHTKNYLGKSVAIFFRSYALIMLITFIELSIGFTILGLSKAVFIAMGIAIFDILPVLGTGGVLIPWIVIATLLGNYKMAVGILIIYLVVTSIRNVIEPKLVGSQLGLHPLVTLISMFVGANFLGIVGLFGVPFTVSLILYLRRTGAISWKKEEEVS